MSNPKTGLFIALEGTDGSGKTTQFKKLVERLEGNGYEVATFDFPQYDKPSSHFIKKYLNGDYGSAEEVGPYTGSLFYALDRYEAAPAIRRALNAGKIVLTNRFTGSNMAHQGTKFDNSEQRRGYFIWLDNLEFEMLNIPRPNLSVVLRVPANVAQRLVDQKEARNYTAKKRDLHEADLSHLQKSVEVYDDLCQLFPKDFSRLDCVRDGELLSIDDISNLLWEKLAPLLPPAKNRPRQTATETTSSSEVSQDNSTTEISDSSPQPTIEISYLLAEKLEGSKALNGHLTGYTHDKPSYYTPGELDMATTRLYQQKMDQIFDLHSEMTHQLKEKAKPSSKVLDAALKPVMPTATLLTTKLPISGRKLERLAVSLVAEGFSEASNIVSESPKKQTGKPGNKDGNVIEQLAHNLLSENHSGSNQPVILTDVWPRNELNLVPGILYEYSNLSLDELEKIVDGWSYEEKSKILKTYASAQLKRHRSSGQALERAYYSWDLICSYETFRYLQRRVVAGGLDRQTLTPRYGYEIPKLIEESGLTDMFEQCFDISLELYSRLQSAGYDNLSQYATLLGHKTRFKLTCNISEAFRLITGFNSQSPAGFDKLRQHLLEKVAEVHPILAETVQSKAMKNKPMAFHSGK